MIIGRGDIAKSLQDREGFTFFVRGVSNREPISHATTSRELSQLEELDPTQMLVYVSSLSIYYADTPYAKHKRYMENYVRERFRNYCILRIGTITWGDNPNTIINYLKHRILSNMEYEVRNEYRYLLDAEELNHWCGMIPATGKHEMNITGRRVKVSQIVDMIKQGEL